MDQPEQQQVTCKLLASLCEPGQKPVSRTEQSRGFPRYKWASASQSLKIQAGKAQWRVCGVTGKALYYTLYTALKCLYAFDLVIIELVVTQPKEIIRKLFMECSSQYYL